MKSPATKPQPQQTEPMGPAVVTPLHVWDRPATDDKGRPIIGKSGCTKWTPLEAAFNQGKLKGGSSKYTPNARFNAGTAYAKLWDGAMPGTTDSTQALNISRSAGSGGNLTEDQSSCMAKLICVESHLSQRDRIIVRMVCGQGYFPSEAVRMVCEDYKDSVTARFRESLDSLIEAFETARRKPGRVAL